MNSNNKNIQDSRITNTQVSQSTNSSSQSFDGDIQKAKQYNQQVGTSGPGSMTSSANSSISSAQSFDGDIQKAKQYNQKIGTSGLGNMTSSTNSSNS